MNDTFTLTSPTDESVPSRSVLDFVTKDSFVSLDTKFKLKKKSVFLNSDDLDTQISMIHTMRLEKHQKIVLLVDQIFPMKVV